MRQLFWKEWHELRLLPPAAALCVVLLVLAAKVFVQEYDGHRFIFDDTMLPLLGTWMLLGLLAGASLFAQEVRSGGLQFLSALPVSRRRLWGVKVLAALGLLVACAAACALACAVADDCLFGSVFAEPLWQGPNVPRELAAYALDTVAVFSAALAVSPFLDRTISTFVAALLVSLAGAVSLGNSPTGTWRDTISLRSSGPTTPRYTSRWPCSASSCAPTSPSGRSPRARTCARTSGSVSARTPAWRLWPSPC